MKRWKRFEELPRRFRRAYESNLEKSPDFSENLLPNGALIFQNGGAFPALRFRRVGMSGVCCGIMAVYNALVLSGISADYLKLAAEFEGGAATPAVPAGAFGTLPWRIGACLSAYGAEFVKCRSLAEFEEALTVGRVGVLCYRFAAADPRAHTFTVQRTAEGVAAYNHFSNYREVEKRKTVKEILNAKNVFMAGFVLKKAV